MLAAAGTQSTAGTQATAMKQETRVTSTTADARKSLMPTRYELSQKFRKN
jgi:hypothetical protein